MARAIFTYSPEARPVMRKRTLIRFAGILLVMFSTHALGNIRLSPLLSDNMVLQRDSRVNIWGWADPGEQVRVQAGWLTSSVSVIADPDGRWSVQVMTSRAGGPYRLSIKGKNTVLLKNIMLGEVWVCSGQSNMEFTIRNLGGSDSIYKADKEELVKGDFSGMRIFTVLKDTSNVPLEMCSGWWTVANADSFENVSATAYFFGRELYKKLNVPVGLIVSSWGGTPAETWTRKDYIEGDKDLRFYLDDPNKSQWWPARPGLLYNAMIHPLLRYLMKGVIWYQGESNRNDAYLYKKLMTALITNWRADWGQGEFPFYYVQIAPFLYDEPLSGTLLREAQLKTMTVPNTGMAVTMDIGSVHDIHPKNKQDVGRRLALWALAKSYGIKVPAFSGPVYRSMQKERNQIRLSFDHSDGGLEVRGGTLTGFTIAGRDRNFVDAEAIIDGMTVVVSSPRVTEPEAVRFAFVDTASSRLYNAAGLPASSFRTDDWPILTEAVSLTAAYDPHGRAIHIGIVRRPAWCAIHFTLDGSDPTAQSPLFGDTITMKTSGTLKARAFRDNIGSTLIASCDVVMHAATGKKVVYTTSFSPAYPGGGSLGLVDGLKGSLNFRDGLWQGFKKDDLDVTIDLGDTINITSIGTAYLQNTGSWIFLPKRLEYSLSTDGQAFSKIVPLVNDVPDSLVGPIRKEFNVTVNGVTARYVKVHAENVGQCPAWHSGRGGDAWLFVDEIVVNGRKTGI
jgi:sialate O-acetylesterase